MRDVNLGRCWTARIAWALAVSTAGAAGAQPSAQGEADNQDADATASDDSAPATSARPESRSDDAPPPPTPEEADAERRVEARRHFDSGLKLFHDGNFKGALAEFEAAYTVNASAGALRNVALCQKALYRYAEASDSLQQLLERHGEQLGPAERKAVEDTITELATLVGRVTIAVLPPTADVEVDGRPTDAEQREGGIRLNVGEHTVVANAPGYARLTRVIRVAGGEVSHQDLGLEPTMGFLTIVTGDPDAAIAVDGEAKAFNQWSGPVKPGKRLVQVYKEGFEPFEEKVKVELGQTVQVRAELGPSGSAGPGTIKLDAPPPPPGSRFFMQQGWYALGSLTLLGVSDAPHGLDHDVQAGDTQIGGVTLGVRAGYRLWNPLAVEALIEGGGFPVAKACDDDLDWAPCGKGQVNRDYTLTTVRLGGNARLLSGGEKIRFTSTLGTGSVRHKLDVPELDQSALDKLLASHSEQEVAQIDGAIRAEGWNPYFMLEVGVQMNVKHALFEVNGTVFIDGTANTRTEDGAQPYRGLVFGGLGLRAGWSEWSPRPGAKFRAAEPPP